jgi:hypothetical protein
MTMTTREALARWRDKMKDQVAAEVIEAVLVTAAAQEEAEAKLVDLLGQLADAGRALTEIRTTAERENRERKERIVAARATIEKAEADARERVQGIERDAAQRVTAERTKADGDLATVKAQVTAQIAAVRAELASERGVLAQMKARVETFRAEMAPLVGPR